MIFGLDTWDSNLPLWTVHIGYSLCRLLSSKCRPAIKLNLSLSEIKSRANRLLILTTTRIGSVNNWDRRPTSTEIDCMWEKMFQRHTIWGNCHIHCLIHYTTLTFSVLQSQKAVIVYLKSKQLLFFASAGQYQYS